VGFFQAKRSAPRCCGCILAEVHRQHCRPRGCMNLRPGSLPRLLVCHSLRAGFSDVRPTIGFFTIASLK
jgi:hypothetical protein